MGNNADTAIKPLRVTESGDPSASADALSKLETELAALRAAHSKQSVELEAMKAHLANVTIALIQKETQLNRITSTLGWRLMTWYGPIKYRCVLPIYRWLKNPLRGRTAGEETRFALQAPERQLEIKDDTYQAWARWCEQIRYDPERARRRIARMESRPLISLLMPVYNPEREHLTKALDSVINQYYPDWELCIADDASREPHVRVVLEDYASRDDRIKVVFRRTNGGISAASNEALALASGSFIGLLDHDDEITPDAMLQVASVIAQADADLIYSDEDKIDSLGQRCEAFFKPAWSPDLLLSCNYISHFGVYRKNIVDDIGGFREGVEGSQDYDLALRFTERTDKVFHIPAVLYHWRKSGASAAGNHQAKPYAYEASAKSLADALRRRGIPGIVENSQFRGFYRVKRFLSSPGKVSIIIPTRDRLSLLHACIMSIESKTEYRDFEIIIVDNGSQNPATLDYLKRTRHTVIRDNRPFNFSRLNNTAAGMVDGEYLLLLNNDTEVISSEWLSAMIEHAQRPEVGAVGAKLIYPQGLIQHAGVILGLGGVADHSQKLVEGREGTGYSNFPNVVRNYTAVTAACMMIRRSLYDEVGGMNEEDLPVAFNDVDLCLRLRRLGYLIVYTPYATLYHKESASRGFDVNEREVSYFSGAWGSDIIGDPYYNPNLTLTNPGFSVDFSKPEALYCTYSHDLMSGVVSKVKSGDCIGQYFFAGQNHLSAIGVRFATNHKRCSGKLRFHLRASHESTEDLAFMEVDASEVPGGEFYTFPFEPMPESRGEMFYFFIEFRDTSGPLTLYKSSVTNDVVGPHFRGHLPGEGTLTLRVFCHGQFR